MSLIARYFVDFFVKSTYSHHHRYHNILFLRFLVIGTQSRNFIPTPGWYTTRVGIQFLPPGWYTTRVGIQFLSPGWSIWRIFCYFDGYFSISWIFPSFWPIFHSISRIILRFPSIKGYKFENFVKLIMIWIKVSFVCLVVLSLKFVRIGLLTNRLGRNERKVVVRPTNFSTCKYFDIHRNQHTHFSTYMISSCMYFNILQFDMHNNSTYIFSTSNFFNINIISAYIIST